MNFNQSDLNTRPEILLAKQRYGMWFGIVIGSAFAIFTWGIDAYQLSTVNGFHPWLKFVVGAVPAMTAGGLTGWLSAKFDKTIVALLLWTLTAAFYAWLTLSLPLQIAPALFNIIEPDLRGLLHFVYYPDFVVRIGVAFAWIFLFVSVIGLLQIPLSEPAVFSTTLFSKLIPILFCFILTGICGTIVDGLNNEQPRLSVIAMNSTIQFFVDHQGKATDPTEARQKHVGSLRAVQNLVTPERKLTVSSYDAYQGEIDILIRFKNAWVECAVFYNQPGNCKETVISP
jgi:hypothetical protein